MDPELLDLLSDVSQLSNQRLTDAEARLREHAHAAHADQDIDALTAAVEAVESVRAESARRQAAADELLARVDVDEPAEESDPDATDEGTDDEPEAVAADAGTTRRPSPAGMARHRSARHAPRGNGGSDLRILTPEGPVLQGVDDLVRRFSEVLPQLARGKAGQTVVASVLQPFPEARQLGADPFANAQLIAAVTSPDVITAAGGRCAPVGALYELFNISSAARPVRDALAGFQATRGGVRFIEPPKLTDLESAVVVWTEANDATPGSDGPATKPCLTVECGTETEVNVHAVPLCLQFGNMPARAHPEQVETWLTLGMAQQAREAENRLWTDLVANSTAITTGQLLGTARDVLANLDRIASQYRSRHRMGERAALRFLAPSWLRDMIRADLTRQLPGDNAIAVADAEIDRFFSTRSINVTWSLDADQVLGAQGAGAALGWPTDVETLLFAEGSHLFLDSGVLDLGVVRDSSLNETNDFQIFTETFEATAFVGVESLAITFDVCPDGSTSATSDIDPCVIGS